MAFLTLSDAQYARLLDRIEASFSRDAQGAPMALGAVGPWGEVFYHSPERFHLFHTCNVWLGEVLRAAGQPFGRWTPTTYAVRLSLWRFAS